MWFPNNGWDTQQKPNPRPKRGDARLGLPINKTLTQLKGHLLASLNSSKTKQNISNQPGNRPTMQPKPNTQGSPNPLYFPYPGVPSPPPPPFFLGGGEPAFPQRATAPRLDAVLVAALGAQDAAGQGLRAQHLRRDSSDTWPVRRKRQRSPGEKGAQQHGFSSKWLEVLRN